MSVKENAFNLSARRKLSYMMFSIFVAAFTSSCVFDNDHHDQNPTLYHVVLFRLNSPDDTTGIRMITDLSRSFSDIPGVLDVVVGNPLPEEQLTGAGTFDVGVIITFSDIKAYHDFLQCPKHQRAKETAKSHIKEIRVIDISGN
jgi:hypothetical protein